MFTRRQLFFEHLAQTSPLPPAIEMTHAAGCNIFDSSGKKYLDLISGISVSNLGHGNERIRKAIAAQLQNSLHLMVYGEHIIPPQVDLASALCGLLPKNLGCIYLTNSGAEATEGAMKLAKRFTGRTGFISFRNSYHGSTQGALSICGNETLKNAYRPLLPGHTVIDFKDESQLDLIDEETAAVFAEPIQGEAGIILPKKNYLEKLRSRCNETKTLLVFDEIQTGMGRTGKLFSFMYENVVPDILLVGKAFGGGMPLGGFVSSKEIMSVFSHDPALGNLTTFGGHPVSCAAALEAFRILTSGDLVAGVMEKEKLFRALLIHGKIMEVRGRGLLLSVEFGNEALNMEVIQRCYEKGILSDWFLFKSTCMRIAPPLIISDDEIRFACRKIIEAIDESVKNLN